MSSIDHLYRETKRLQVEDHLNLLSVQYLVQCLDTENVYHQDGSSTKGNEGDNQHQTLSNRVTITGACGTLRQNRKHVPFGIKNTKPPKGETVVMSNDPLVILKHTDKRPVTMCSTIHNIKPDAIIAYNKYMGCVDHSDQLLQYLATRHRTLKWYKKVMFHLFDLCNVQAHIVYKLQTDKPMAHRTFNREVVKQILSSVQLPLL